MGLNKPYELGTDVPDSYGALRKVTKRKQGCHPAFGPLLGQRPGGVVDPGAQDDMRRLDEAFSHDLLDAGLRCL